MFLLLLFGVCLHGAGLGGLPCWRAAFGFTTDQLTGLACNGAWRVARLSWRSRNGFSHETTSRRRALIGAPAEYPLGLGAAEKGARKVDVDVDV